MKKTVSILALSFFLILSVESAYSQCSMCRRVVETNQESNAYRTGKSLNSGILYLMAVPYLLGAIGVAIWWKSKNKQ
ncbi:MAG: hypothetical protein EYC69_04230 [Bacteroidetes bacterium]|nr:MAG: hypothetical protein EYC69_04230 [Bacteroidota bacterium]